ncbi:MAG: PKD domain-containing protein [Bacteroidales bacterium]|nr:PKD domain-containing protein [Bacteroidales bacterium]
MKRFTLFTCMMLMLILPTRLNAQYQTTMENQPTISFDMTNIALFDERVFFLYNLMSDGRFDLITGERDGVFVISTNEAYDGIDLKEAFADFREQNAIDFSRMDKVQASEVAREYKTELPTEFANSVMMEYYSRSRDNSTCANADPFCTDNGMYQFPASTYANPGESGPYYDCLNSQPNPAWYYLQIDNPGNIDIYMYSTPSVDIDFCCWGPFSDPSSPCPYGLTSDKVVSCSYSASDTEHCLIPASAQTGDYFILVITNYSNQSCDISFSKVAGTGTTNCGILPPLVDNSGPYCVGETINLTANGQAGASYSWTGPSGFTSNQQNPTRPNCTLNMAGTYTCTITLGSATNSATTEVVIYPMPTANFNYTTVCVGTATQFTSTSTTNPAGQTIQSYQWNFGDGQTGTGQTTTHTYANAGTYQVTLTVSCGGHCTSEKTQTVTVYGQPTSNFNYTTVCKGNPTQFTSTATAPAGQTISSYQWDFGDGQTGNGQTVSHTYAQAGNYQVTHTVGIGNGNCTGSRTQTVPVNATPAPTATAQPNIVIYGGVATLTANAGTTGTFNFHWEPADKVVNPNNQTTQTIALQQTTTFTCTVTNPQGNCTGSTQVTVTIEGSNMFAQAAADNNDLCEGESTTLHAMPSGGTGNYTFAWAPANTLNNPNIQDPVATPPLGQTTYTCHVSDGLSAQDVSVTVFVHPHTESDISATICPDDTYNFFGELLNAEGTYDHVVPTQYGCDSTIHLHLTHHEVFETPISDRFCEGDPYDFFGEQLTGSGIYYHTLETVNGCDSIIRLNLTQDPSYEIELVESTCEGGPGYYFAPLDTYFPPSPFPNILVFETLHGCDSIVFLTVEEAEYNSKTYNVSLCAEQYTWPSNGTTYYETGVYYDTLHVAGSCDSTIVLNLELRPSYNLEERVTSCDTYRWKDDNYNVDMTFNESTVYTHHYVNSFGCDSEVTLYLSIYDHDENDLPLQELCDEYFWDPGDHEIVYTDHEDPIYNMSGTYHRTYKNQADCDSLVTLNLQFEYTPTPTAIYPMDAENVTPHWVITSTEFQINSYDFNLWDMNPNCHWDTVVWTCNEAPDWILEPFGEKGKCCKVYVLNRVEDTIWLKAHAFNRCTQDAGVEQKYWLLSSFYGVEEKESSPADFSVVPNPNNGQMTLNFDYLTGKTKVKVYDMKGALIDQFETDNINGPSSYIYQMNEPVDGVYFFVATSKEGTVAKKVIIKK